MTLSAGTKLGPYEVVEPIGSGGMGQVWRARDTRLDREVAIKVLPPDFARNDELRSRFEREARAISALNHPHICALYDVGQTVVSPETEGESTLHYLVMELIDGESLLERLKKGPLPLEQVLRYGRQLAEGLDAAHRRGIVHRDLKPGNVMLTRSGVKLLDFGLAKTAVDGSPIEGLASAPTEARPLTREGAILGTFQYMAPEQLEGLEADVRTDIFALGELLYEMATGQRAFQANSKTGLIAAIVSSQPEPISRTAPMTPPALEHVVRRCLEKDPEDRWQSAHDVASELQWISEAGSQPGIAEPRIHGTKRFRRWHAVAAGLFVMGVLFGAVVTRLGSEKRDLAERGLPPRRYVIEHGDLRGSRPQISPDGTRIAFAARGSIWIHDLSELDAFPVAGTEQGNVPTWSPDGDWLAFSAGGELFKIRVDGSGKTRLCQPAPGSTSGAAVWLPDGRIVFDTGWSGIYEVSDRGGDPRVVLEPQSGEADFHFLSALPDGKGFLFVVHEGETFDNITLWDGAQRKTLLRLPGDSIDAPVYSPSGHILFSRNGAGVWGVDFSLDPLEVTGEPFPIAPRGDWLSLAPNGTLVYVATLPPVLSEIVVLDRLGRVVRTIGAPRRGIYPTPALSPDGGRLVVPIASGSGFDLWLYELGGGEPRRLTFDESFKTDTPAWTPDGKEVVFTRATGTNDISLRAIDVEQGGEVRDLGKGLGPVAFTASGETMLYDRAAEGFNLDLWKKKLTEDGPGEPLLTDPDDELDPSLSPDGRWVAYDVSGTVFIRSYPDMGARLEVASGNAAVPRWSPKGDRLFYLAGSDLMEVGVTAGSSIRLGASRKLFALPQVPASPYSHPLFAVGPDGETFIAVRPLEPIPGIVVVQNWLATVR